MTQPAATPADSPPLQLDQFYFTHCTYGTSTLHRRTDATQKNSFDYGARAGSKPGDESQKLYVLVERFMLYELPGDIRNNDPQWFAKWKSPTTGRFNTPLRLVYVPDLDGKQFAAHIGYRMFDTQGRPHSYFAHVLFASGGTTKGLTNLNALRLWGAPGWVREDQVYLKHDLESFPRPGADANGTPAPDAFAELTNRPFPEADRSVGDFPLLNFLTLPALADGAEPRDWPACVPDRWRRKSPEDRRRLLTFVLRKLVETPFQQSDAAGAVFIAVEPDLAALLFYGAIRLLPPHIGREKISFSTYETHGRRPGTVLAATCFQNPDTPPADLARSQICLNTFNAADLERTLTSVDSAPDDYASIIIRKLLSGQDADRGKRWSALGDVHKSLEKLKVDKFDEMCRVIAADALVNKFLAPNGHDWSTLEIPATGKAREYLRHAVGERIGRTLHNPQQLDQLLSDADHLLRLLRLLGTKDRRSDAEEDFLRRAVTSPALSLPQLIKAPEIDLRLKATALVEYLIRADVKEFPAGCETVWPQSGSGHKSDPALLEAVMSQLDGGQLYELLARYVDLHSQHPERTKLITDILRALLKVCAGDKSQEKRETLAIFLVHPVLAGESQPHAADPAPATEAPAADSVYSVPGETAPAPAATDSAAPGNEVLSDIEWAILKDKTLRDGMATHAAAQIQALYGCLLHNLNLPEPKMPDCRLEEAVAVLHAGKEVLKPTDRPLIEAWEGIVSTFKEIGELERNPPGLWQKVSGLFGQEQGPTFESLGADLRVCASRLYPKTTRVAWANQLQTLYRKHYNKKLNPATYTAITSETTAPTAPIVLGRKPQEKKGGSMLPFWIIAGVVVLVAGTGLYKFVIEPGLNGPAPAVAGLEDPSDSPAPLPPPDPVTPSPPGPVTPPDPAPVTPPDPAPVEPTPPATPTPPEPPAPVPNGTAPPTPPEPAATLITDRVLHFPAVDSHAVLLKSGGLPDLNKPFTIEMLVRWPSVPTSSQVLASCYKRSAEGETPVSASGWELSLIVPVGPTPPNVQLRLKVAKTPSPTDLLDLALAKDINGPEFELVAGQWYHIAVTRSQGAPITGNQAPPEQIRIWLDGKAEGDAPLVSLPWTSGKPEEDLWLGKSRVSPNLNLLADIRGIRISDFAQDFTSPKPAGEIVLKNNAADGQTVLAYDFRAGIADVDAVLTLESDAKLVKDETEEKTEDMPPPVIDSELDPSQVYLAVHDPAFTIPPTLKGEERPEYQILAPHGGNNQTAIRLHGVHAVNSVLQNVTATGDGGARAFGIKVLNSRQVQVSLLPASAEIRPDDWKTPICEFQLDKTDVRFKWFKFSGANAEQKRDYAPWVKFLVLEIKPPDADSRFISFVPPVRVGAASFGAGGGSVSTDRHSNLLNGTDYYLARGHLVVSRLPADGGPLNVPFSNETPPRQAKFPLPELVTAFPFLESAILETKKRPAQITFTASLAHKDVAHAEAKDMAAGAINAQLKLAFNDSRAKENTKEKRSEALRELEKLLGMTRDPKAPGETDPKFLDWVIENVAKPAKMKAQSLQAEAAELRRTSNKAKTELLGQCNALHGVLYRDADRVRVEAIIIGNAK